MSLLHRLPHPESYEQPVIETLQNSGLELPRVLLVGSAVLALEGIRPAHDVDVIIHPREFAAIQAKQGNDRFTTTLHPKSYLPVLRAEGLAMPLSMDLITKWGPAGDPTIAENMFERALEESEVAANGLRHISLAAVRHHKSSSRRLKDRFDIRRIDDHLQKQSRLATSGRKVV